ncbi:hypothetical protein JOM56_010094 [Amanita muscaria]
MEIFSADAVDHITPLGRTPLSLLKNPVSSLGSRTRISDAIDMFMLPPLGRSKTPPQTPLLAVIARKFDAAARLLLASFCTDHTPYCYYLTLCFAIMLTLSFGHQDAVADFRMLQLAVCSVTLSSLLARCSYQRGYSLTKDNNLLGISDLTENPCSTRNSSNTSISTNAPERSAVHNDEDFTMHHPEHEEDHVQSGGENLNDDILEPRNLTPPPEPPLEIESFPSDFAGMPISQAAANVDDCDRSSDEFGPFKLLIDWEVAKWAKLRGPLSSALNELLAIDGLVERLGLSFKSLPGRPTFHHQRITVSGETVSLYSRDIIECISTLYGDPKFVHHLINRPERQYKKEGDHRTRVFHDMHTGDWWWEMQNVLEARKHGATIVPVLLSSDRTQVTVFGSKTAYPVYVTIGNLPKEIRRKPSCHGQVLLAYLPASKLKHVTRVASRRRMLVNLFHFCMQRILEPLEIAGIEGVVMKDGHGTARRIHPIGPGRGGAYPCRIHW